MDMCWDSPSNLFRHNDLALFFDANPDLAALEDELLWRFDHLHYVKHRMGVHRYLETLNFVTACRTMRQACSDGRLLSPQLANAAREQNRPVQCLDVGVKNWSSVSGLSAVLHLETGHHFELHGIELAPDRFNPDGVPCGVRAEENARLEPQARFVPGDVLAFHQPMDIIVLWSPYLFPESAQADDFPMGQFQPQAVLEHLVNNLLRPGGTLLISNQDILEFQTQADMLVPYNICKQFAGPLPQPFLNLPYTRYGWCFTKEGA